jgi:sugar phosphate permease
MASKQTELIGADPRARAGGFRWIIVTLVFIVYTAAYADRANIGIALPFMKREFLLSNTQAGLLASAFTFAYAFSQLPAAFVIGRFGVRKTLPVFMVLTSAATLAIGFSSTLLAVLALRILLGIVEAPLAVATMTTINNWFPKQEKGTAAGVLLAATKFAPLIVPPIGALILMSFGWRWVFMLLAIPGVFLAVVWLTFVSDSPRSSRFVSDREADYIENDGAAIATTPSPLPPTRGPAGFARLDRCLRAREVVPLETARAVLLSPNIWGVALGYFFIQGIVGFILAWLPTYLTEVKKLAILNVGFVAASPFAGAVLGNLFGGLLSDRLLGGRRKPTMLMSSAFTIVMMYLLTIAPSQPLLLALQLFATGFLLSIGLASFTIYPARLTGRRAFPVGMGIINMGGQLGGAFFPLITGILLDRYDWTIVFHALAGGAALAFAVLLFAIEPVARTETDQAR